MPRASLATQLHRWKHETLLVLDKGIGLLFPDRCVQCGKLGERFCPACYSKISWITPPFCPICGLPVTHQRRHTCVNKKYITQIRSAALFSGPMRKALHALKYRGETSLAEYLTKISLSMWPLSEWNIQSIIPIPMGQKRKRMRGYNQAQLIAQSISEMTKIPMETDCLFRTKETRSQVGLSLEDRKENLRDAFLAQSVQGKRIVLVDDVCTSGATMEGGAKALRDSGAEAVFGIAVARAIPAFLLNHLVVPHPMSGEST